MSSVPRPRTWHRIRYPSPEADDGGSLRDDELVRHGLTLLSRVRIPGEFRIVDAVDFPGALDRRHAVPPGLRSDGVGGSPAELGGEVRRWVVLQGGEPGGVAGREFLAGDLGSVQLRGVVLIPPDTGLLLLLELRASSEEHTSELQSHSDLVCRLLLEKKKH